MSESDTERNGSRLENDDSSYCKKCGWDLSAEPSNGLCERCNDEARKKLPTIPSMELGGIESE